MGAAQELAVGHAGQDDVVGELRLAGHLGPRVDLRKRAADDREAVFRHGWALPHPLGSPAAAPRPALHAQGGQLDRVEDLGVAGAPAEVPGQRVLTSSRVGLGRRRGGPGR